MATTDDPDPEAARRWILAHDAEFGARLKRHRLALGLSQRRLAKLAGCSDAFLCQLERGNGGAPGADILGRLAALFGVTMDDLWTRGRTFMEENERALSVREVFDVLRAWKAPEGWERRVFMDAERPVGILLLIHPDEGYVMNEFGGHLTRSVINRRLDAAVGRFLEAKAAHPEKHSFVGHPDAGEVKPI